MEDAVPEGLQYSLEHLTAVQRAGVVHGRENPDHLQIGIEPVDDLRDRIGQQGNTAQREELAFERNDDLVGGGQRIDRQQAQRRRTIDEDEVVAVAYPIEHPLQALFTGDFADQLHFGRRQIDIGRQQIHAFGRGGQHDLVERVLTAEQQVVDRLVEVVRVHAEPHRQRTLRIEVDQENAASGFCQRGAQVDGARRLADATLLIGHRDDDRVLGPGLRRRRLGQIRQRTPGRSELRFWFDRLDILGGLDLEQPIVCPR